MSTAHSVLPLEIAYRILDFLHDSPHALWACSLVHSTWRPHAQRLLSATVFLRDRRAYASLRRGLVQRGPDTGSGPRVTKCLCRRTTRLEITEDGQRPYTYDAILTFASNLLDLKSLAISGARWTERARMHAVPSLAAFSKVGVLELSSCRFLACSDLMRVVSTLPSLCDLTLIKVNLGKPSEGVGESVVAATKTRLRRLRAELLVPEDTCLSRLVTWITQSQRENATLEDLAIITQTKGSGTVHHSAIEQLLLSLGTTLINVDVPVFLHVMEEDHFLNGLSKNTALRTLVLRYTFREDWRLAWEKIVRTLNSIASQYLHTIELVLTILRASVTDDNGMPDGAMLADQWGPINSVLASERFRCLRKANITVDWRIADTIPSPVVKYLQQAIEKGMEQLEWHKRGIMTITHREQALTIPPRTLDAGDGGVREDKGTSWDDVWSRIGAE